MDGARVAEANRELVTSLDPQTIEQLKQALSGAVDLDGLTDQLESVFGTRFDKLTKELGKNLSPEEQHKAMRDIGEKMTQAIAGRGPKSLNSIIGKMGTVWAKQISVTTASGIDDLGEELKSATKQPNVVQTTPTDTGGTPLSSS